MEKKMDMDLLRSKHGFVSDMDGVIYHGNQLLPGVRQFVDWLKATDKRFLFLTNASGKSPKELRYKLHRMGLEVEEENFYTSALATARFLQKQAPGCSAFVIGHFMGEHEQAIVVVKFLCYIAIYVFGTNIFRNLRDISPAGSPWYRFFDLCYYILSVQFIIF